MILKFVIIVFGYIMLKEVMIKDSNMLFKYCMILGCKFVFNNVLIEDINIL